MLDLNPLFRPHRGVRGLTAASRNLNVPKSTVSYRLQQLEASFGIWLINRTSRSRAIPIID
jgi:DNA-binding transcriptional LysR family regulator